MVDTKILNFNEFWVKEDKVEEKKEEVIRSKIRKLFDIIDKIEHSWADIIRKAVAENDFAWLLDLSNRRKLRKFRTTINEIKNIYPTVNRTKLLALCEYDQTLGAKMEPKPWYNDCIHALHDLKLNSYETALNDLKSTWVMMFERWETRFVSIPAHYSLDTAMYHQKIEHLRRIRDNYLKELEQARISIGENLHNAEKVLPGLEDEYKKRKHEAIIHVREIRRSMIERIKAIKYLNTISEDLRDGEKTFTDFKKSRKPIFSEIMAKLDKKSKEFIDSLPVIWSKYREQIELIRKNERVDYGEIKALESLGVNTQLLKIKDYQKLEKKPVPEYVQFTMNILSAVGELNNRINDTITECEKIANNIEKEKEIYDKKLHKLFLRAEAFRSKWNREGVKPKQLSDNGRTILDQVNISIKMIYYLHSGKNIINYSAEEKERLGMQTVSNKSALDILDRNFDHLTNDLLEIAEQAKKSAAASREEAEDFSKKVARLLSETKNKGKFDIFVNDFVRLNKAIFPLINQNIPKEITTFYRLRPAIIEILTNISKNNIMPVPKLMEISLGMGASHEEAVAKIEELFNLDRFKSMLEKLAKDVKHGKITAKAA